MTTFIVVLSQYTFAFWQMLTISGLRKGKSYRSCFPDAIGFFRPLASILYRLTPGFPGFRRTGFAEVQRSAVEQYRPR